MPGGFAHELENALELNRTPVCKPEKKIVPKFDVPKGFTHELGNGLGLNRIPVCENIFVPKRFGTKTDSVCKAKKKLWSAFFASLEY